MFISRNIELIQVIKLLEQRKAINVYGSYGVGKSDFVLNLGHILANRTFYPEGVYFFSLQKFFDKIESEKLSKYGLIDFMAEDLGGEFKI